MPSIPHPTHPRQADVVIIGGGSTGASIARDAALRGLRAILIEKTGLGAGTTGRFHGMLHSGARYVVNDPATAKECFTENQILRRIAAPAIHDTGGLFLALDDDEAGHGDILTQACNQQGIPIRDISLPEATKREPHITRKLKRALAVPDGFIDSKVLLQLLRQSAESADTPATFLTHHEVTALGRANHRLETVTVRDTQSGRQFAIECGFVINAAGVWAGRVGALAGVTIDLVLDKGTMVVLQDQLNRAVLNRCRPEADGDLLVSTGTHSIMGTTSLIAPEPSVIDNPQPTTAEIELLIREGARLVPRLATSPIISAYSGVRPLFKTAQPTSKSQSSRNIRRSFTVIDHQAAGIENFISVVGGKVTTSRRMAEAAIDLLCAKQTITASCQTAQVPLAGHPVPAETEQSLL
ncbi:MAG TPA: FAD-dependent oxidoreductase [Candidatus Saccharimonadia bacterium]|nr:FAD-dependent oxidoreductase [Candidatus Saccharimonadia bacterium]